MRKTRNNRKICKIPHFQQNPQNPLDPQIRFQARKLPTTFDHVSFKPIEKWQSKPVSSHSQVT
jgi:hypothetical protein